MKHGQPLAWVLGETPPIFSIGYEPPTSPHDSGLTILFDDAPDPDELADSSEDPGKWICVHCLIDEHPEIGRGLDIARTHGAADLNDAGEWIGRHLEPLA